MKYAQIAKKWEIRSQSRGRFHIVQCEHVSDVGLGAEHWGGGARCGGGRRRGRGLEILVIYCNTGRVAFRSHKAGFFVAIFFRYKR